MCCSLLNHAKYRDRGGVNIILCEEVHGQLSSTIDRLQIENKRTFPIGAQAIHHHPRQACNVFSCAD